MSDTNRVDLSFIKETTYGVNPAPRAQGTITMVANPIATETVTVGTSVYKFEAAVSGAAKDVLLGSTLAESQANLVAAINLTGSAGGAGVQYHTDTVINVEARAADFSDNQCIITAITPGVGAAGTGNSTVFSEAMAGAGNVVDGSGTLGTTTLGVNGTFLEVPFTDESLITTSDTVRSNRIRDDRQTPDIVRTSHNGGGSINTELNFADLDTFLEGSLLSGVFAGAAAIITAQTTVDFANTAGVNTLSDSGNGLAAATQYGWIKVSGAANSENNGIWKVLTSAAGVLTLEGKTMVTEAVGQPITIALGSEIKNGVTESSFTLQKEFKDLTEEVETFTGQEIGQLNIEIPLESVITIGFDFIGKPGVSDTHVNASTLTAASNNPSMNSIDGVDAILEGGLVTSATSLNLTLNNSLRPNPELGTLGPIAIGTGSVMVNGTLEVYFQDKILMNKFLNFTASTLALIVKDSSDNYYIIDLPQVKYISGERIAGGKNLDLIASLGFESYRNATQDYTIKIAKL